MIDFNKVAKTEEILTSLFDFIHNEDKTPKNEDGLEDGRTQSTLAEKTYAIPLISKFVAESETSKKYQLKLEVPGKRSWADVILISDKDGLFIPCNIKISDFKSADNLNCRHADLVVTTGYYEKFENEIKFEVASIKLWNQIKKLHYKHYKKPVDYYFLVFNKQDASKSYFTSLLTVKELVSNGSNGAQANWETNRKLGRTSILPVTPEDVQGDIARGLMPREYRSYSDSIDYVIDKCIDSELKKIESARYNIKIYKRIKRSAKRAHPNK